MSVFVCKIKIVFMEPVQFPLKEQAQKDQLCKCYDSEEKDEHTAKSMAGLTN